MVSWIHSISSAGGEQTRPLASLLRRSGVETKEYGWTVERAPGVVLVPECNEDAFGFIRNASSCGGARIVVLVCEKVALAPGAAWKLLSAGASDVMVWDGTSEVADNVAARLKRWNAIDEILDSAVVKGNLIGRSAAWVRVLRDVIEMARFSSASVLISGESGTGKELIARLIHTLDARQDKKELVVLDCTTVVPELSGSEFFGHERGAYTGAVTSRDGAFALADGGTLFLDEIGELPRTLQAELLRVVQEHTYKRVGSNTWHKTEFRLVSASNRELRPERNAKGFRPDLYYRITSWRCCLPPLRDRREDIPALAQYFVTTNWMNGDPPQIDDDVLEYLIAREYPGNIRELRQLVVRMVQRHTGRGAFTTGDLLEDEQICRTPNRQFWLDETFANRVRSAVALGATMKEIRRAAEDLAVRGAVAEENGNWHRAAKRLGLTDRALQLRRAAWRQRGEPSTAIPDSIQEEEE
jgi:transcriptional regulator with GAF, ATPase, and Fis domain